MADILTMCEAGGSIPESENDLLVRVLQHFIRLGVVGMKYYLSLRCYRSHLQMELTMVPISYKGKALIIGGFQKNKL